MPCSAVRWAAISGGACSTRFRIRNMISVRFESDVARHAGNAARAAATAASTSSTDAKSTSRRDLAGRRVVDRAAPSGRARDAPRRRSSDRRFRRPLRGRGTGDVGLGELCHR